MTILQACLPKAILRLEPFQKIAACTAPSLHLLYTGVLHPHQPSLQASHEHVGSCRPDGCFQCNVMASTQPGKGLSHESSSIQQPANHTTQVEDATHSGVDG